MEILQKYLYINITFLVPKIFHKILLFLMNKKPANLPALKILTI